MGDGVAIISGLTTAVFELALLLDPATVLLLAAASGRQA
jgi:hypothetical protein